VNGPGIAGATSSQHSTQKPITMVEAVSRSGSRVLPARGNRTITGSRQRVANTTQTRGIQGSEIRLVM
jgi:hypothetical protein